MCVKIDNQLKIIKKLLLGGIKMAKKEKVTVLAFEKKLVPSDGRMYGTIWDKRNEIETALTLNEKSVRGTISNRQKKKTGKDPVKLNDEIKNPNLQTVDSCSLETGQDTLKLNFTLKFLSGVETPSACNNPNFTRYYKDVAATYIERYGFMELAKRYAVNIANARYLWRNRVGTESLEVCVKILNNGIEGSYRFDASEIGIRNFESSNSDVDKIAEKIGQAISGEIDFLMLDITAFSKIGKAQEVYPSEELVLNKETGEGKKSKVLYDIQEQAAMHSQKIGNALRTIDTWYPDFNPSLGPIAIEPYGAVTNLGKAFRNPTSKKDFYTLFDKYAWGNPLDCEKDEHYVMAVLLRGGVFGESDKK